STLTN
ncbi:hypothetical protein D029_2548B, partial [Vibrio parahaemolyticus 970107]